MADVVDLGSRRLTNPGNGALEKMREYFSEKHNWPTHTETMTEADYFLAWLWLEGFKVVPLSGADVGALQQRGVDVDK